MASVRVAKKKPARAVSKPAAVKPKPAPAKPAPRPHAARPSPKPASRAAKPAPKAHAPTAKPATRPSLAKPVGIVKPLGAAKPVGIVKPVAIGKPVAIVKQVAVAKPAPGATKPLGTVKPVGAPGAAKPIAALKPAGPARPGAPKPVAGAKPGVPPPPAKPGQLKPGAIRPAAKPGAPVAPAAGAPKAAAAKGARKPTIVPPKPAPKIPPEQALLERAQRALSTGDEEQAVRLLEKMIVEFPDDPRGRFELARLKHRRGDEKGALDEYAKILRRDSTDAMALWRKAEIHLGQKPDPDFTQAVACYKKIVQAHGRKKDDLAKRVVDQAKRQLRFCEARKLSLQSRRHLTSESPAQIRKGREILEKALHVYPEDARNHMNLGVAYLLLDEPVRAAELCRAAIELNPGYARAYLMLGRARKMQKQLRAARDSFLKCIELDRSARDAQDAWNDRREVERDMAKVRLTLFQALSGKPGTDGERVRLTLPQMKEMVAMLEGDPVEGADLTLDVRGHYMLTAYSQRHRYRFYPGPESLVVEHDGLTAV